MKGKSDDAFRPPSQRNKCCCGKIHAKTGTMLIGMVYGAVFVSGLVKGVLNYAREAEVCSQLTAKDYHICQQTLSMTLLGQIVAMVIHVLATIALFLGLRTRTSGCFFPFMIIQMTDLLGLIIAFVCVFVYGPKVILGNHSLDVDSTSVRLFLASAPLVPLFLLGLWWFFVVYSYFLFLRANGNKAGPRPENPVDPHCYSYRLVSKGEEEVDNKFHNHYSAVYDPWCNGSHCACEQDFGTPPSERL